MTGVDDDDPLSPLSLLRHVGRLERRAQRLETKHNLLVDILSIGLGAWLGTITEAWAKPVVGWLLAEVIFLAVVAATITVARRFSAMFD